MKNFQVIRGSAVGRIQKSTAKIGKENKKTIHRKPDGRRPNTLS